MTRKEEGETGRPRLPVVSMHTRSESGRGCKFEDGLFIFQGGLSFFLPRTKLNKKPGCFRGAAKAPVVG